MISQSEIDRLAVKLRTSPGNIAREYCQHLLLRAIYKQKEASGLYFKGGTALRLLYQSPRFSEDLDFEGEISVERIESLLLSAGQLIEANGASIEIKEAKSTTGGYLAVVICQLNLEKIEISLEVSLRKRKTAPKGGIMLVTGEFFPSYTVMALTRDELVSGKLEALLFRRKPRDFFDLYFILRANFMPVAERHVLKKIIELIPEDSAIFTRELKKFLPVSHHALIRDFSSVLTGEIKRFI